jgi:hypothetical protein
VVSARRLASPDLVALTRRGLASATPRVTCPSDEELAEYAKQVVDGLPPLTDEQRDTLALIFRNRGNLPIQP